MTIFVRIINPFSTMFVRILFLFLPLLFLSSCGSTFDRNAFQGEWQGVSFEGQHPIILSAEHVRMRFSGEQFEMTGTVSDVKGHFRFMGNTLYLINEQEVELPIAVKSLEGDTLVLNFNRMGEPALLKLSRVR
jgi:hypothetical protein